MPITPVIRRFLAAGFEHAPSKDAPKFGFVCLETALQRVYVNPETGDTRFGRTLTV